MTIDPGQSCPSGHPVGPGQSFCAVCGQAVSTSAPSSVPPAAQTGPKKNVWVIVGAVAGVVVLAVLAFVLVRTLGGPPEVTADNAVELLREGGIVCDEVSSVAAGEGSTEAKLIPATVIDCEVNDSDGNVDSEASVALLVADSEDGLAQVLDVSGMCANESNMTDVIAVGDNWLGASQSAEPSAVLAQQIADALGGSVTTAGQLTARLCLSQ